MADSSPSLAPELTDRILAGAAILLLAAVTVALLRGSSAWADLPLFIWAHIATIYIAVALTPVMLLRRRGDPLHRQLGWAWMTAMFVTCVFTFGIRTINQGAFSLIHLLSVFTLLQIPRIIWSARRHKVDAHRRAVHTLVAGALIIAGAFTFPFDRLMGRWLFG